jgi:Flp pilus assembly protein TadG
MITRKGQVIEPRRGGIMVLAAVFLIVVFAFAAFSIDIGYIAVANADLQNAVDAAAMSGAGHLRNGPYQARAFAIALAANNSSTNNSVLITDSDIELGIWDEDTATFTLLATADESKADAVRVRCSRTQAGGNPLNLFFAPLLGRNTADVTATAIAHAKPSRCGLFIGINKVTLSGGSYTDSYNSDNGPYNPASAGNKGDICSDGSITLSSSSYVHGDALPGNGASVSMSGSSFVTGLTQPRSKPLNLRPVDFGDSATNNVNSTIPLSNGGAVPYDSQNGEFKLSGGDHVALPPGTYHFSKFTLSGGSSITVTGATVIYCVGDFTASGSSIANASQRPTNLQVFCTGGKVDISGGSDFYGAVYAPSSKVVRSSGSNHVYGSLIGRELTLSGGGGAHADTALGLLNGTRGNVKLVE